MTKSKIALMTVLLAVIALYVLSRPKTAHGALIFQTPPPALTTRTVAQTAPKPPEVTAKVAVVTPQAPVVTPAKPVSVFTLPVGASTTPKFTFMLVRSARGVWSIVVR